LFIKRAFIADLFAFCLENQKLTRIYDVIPTPSHARKKYRRLLVVIIKNINNTKRVRLKKKRSFSASSAIYLIEKSCTHKEILVTTKNIIYAALSNIKLKFTSTVP